MEKLFRIYKVTEEKVGKPNPDPDEPHIHEYEELIIGCEGELVHLIDFRTEKYPAPFISFVTKGKAHQLKPNPVNGKFDAWVIEFLSEFIQETTFQLYSNFHGQANLGLQKGERFENMIRLCEMMDKEINLPVVDLSVVRLILSTLFAMIESERKKSDHAEDIFSGSQNLTFRNFLKLLEENFKKPEGVEFYAARLFMSARNLNLICNNVLHKSVSDIVETRKLTEAKNLLISTGKRVSEIGFELGFSEKTYFTTVFKKKTGLTPTEFRQEMSGLIS